MFICHADGNNRILRVSLKGLLQDCLIPLDQNTRVKLLAAWLNAYLWWICFVTRRRLTIGENWSIHHSNERRRVFSNLQWKHLVHFQRPMVWINRQLTFVLIKFGHLAWFMEGVDMLLLWASYPMYNKSDINGYLKYSGLYVQRLKFRYSIHTQFYCLLLPCLTHLLARAPSKWCWSQT